MTSCYFVTMSLYCFRLRWNVGHVHLLCYYFPWQREDLTFTCKASYIIGYYAWALAQLMMGILGILIFSWIAFRECHLVEQCWLKHLLLLPEHSSRLLPKFAFSPIPCPCCFCLSPHVWLSLHVP